MCRIIGNLPAKARKGTQSVRSFDKAIRTELRGNGRKNRRINRRTDRPSEERCFVGPKNSHEKSTANHSVALERIQKRCFRIILGNRYIDYDSALTRFNTTTLEKRRIKLCYKFAKNVLKSPRHRHLFPPSFRDVHEHDTRGHRGGRLMPAIKCNRARYYNSSIPYLVRMMNSEN